MRVYVVAFAALDLDRAYPGRGFQGEDRAVALCSISPNAGRSAACSLLLLPAIALLLAGCEQKKAKTVEARPVRTITATKGGVGETIVLTGQISAENEASLAFRIGGRI